MHFLAYKLALARRQRGWKAKEAAAKLGISAGYYSELESGKKTPSEELLMKLAEVFRCPASSFFDFSVTGETEVGTRAIVAPSGEKLRWVPVISWTHAGQAVDYEELPKHWQDESVPTTCTDEDAFVLIVEGDSMEDHNRAGDRVVVMPNVPPRNDCIVVAKLKSDGVVLRRYARLPSGKIQLIPYNKLYPTLDYDPTDFHWIFPVHSTVRKEW